MRRPMLLSAIFLLAVSLVFVESTAPAASAVSPSGERLQQVTAVPVNIEYVPVVIFTGVGVPVVIIVPVKPDPEPERRTWGYLKKIYR